MNRSSLYTYTVTHGPEGVTWTQEKTAFTDDDDVERHLRQHEQTPGSCRIM